MRLYTFTNFYLSSIQQGIQPAHLVGDMFIKYPNELHDTRSPDHVLHDWAKNHKTMICLNGGNNAGLKQVYGELERIGKFSGLPFGKFHEDEDSLGGVLTCVGVIVPARIYEYNELVRSRATPEQLLEYQTNAQFMWWDWELINLLSKYGLAK